jgi:hypothetical protein
MPIELGALVGCRLVLTIASRLTQFAVVRVARLRVATFTLLGRIVMGGGDVQAVDVGGEATSTRTPTLYHSTRGRNVFAP